MLASAEYASPQKSNNKAPPSLPDGREVERRTFCLVESKFTVENATVAGLQKSKAQAGYQCTPRFGHWSSVDPPITSPQAGRCAERNEECCTQDRNHSLLLSGDADRSCSMFGRDFVVGGEDAADGGDVADSVPSRAASALRTLLVFSSARKAGRNST
jgi:hypothetical protein